MSEMNLEAVAASASVELAKEFVSKTVLTLKGQSRILFERFFPNFEKHLSSTYSRNSSVKIISNRDVPVDFDSIYVSSFFKYDEKTLADVEVVDLVNANKRLVVSAMGGAGKTFLMRFTWMKLFRERSGRVPVFIELRKLNAVSTVDLPTFIRASAFGVDALTEQNFSHFCDEGVFVFVLDGFDEVTREKRQDLESQIIDIAKRYPNCGIVVSGRPDDRFDGWQGFSTIKAIPFDYTQFKALVGKVPFDNQTKLSFMKIADSAFFSLHSSFLSNPLLSLMMLLTYRDNAEIPKKISTFYENCFATLFSQHDALKESFRREKCLDQLEFKRIFSVFCLLTYRDNRYSFDQAEFKKFVEQSRDFLQFKQETSMITHDFLESVNLVVKEGTNYSFIHRSFQEFFAAVCVTSVLTDGISEMLEMFASRTADKTFKLAYEIHPSLVNKHYLFPTYERLKLSSLLYTRRDTAKPYRAVSITDIKVEVDIGTEIPGMPIKRKANGVMIQRVRLSMNGEYESFLFACDEALIQEDWFVKVSNHMYRLFNLSFGILNNVRKGNSALLKGSDWRLQIRFSETGLAVKADSSDGMGSIFPKDSLPTRSRNVEKVGKDLELAITSANRRLVTKLEDALALQTNNKFVFIKPQETEE